MFMYVCALAGWLRRAKVRVNGARDDGTACMWTRNGIVISDDADGCRPPTRREKLSGYEVVIVHDLIGPTPSRWMYRSCVRPFYVTSEELKMDKALAQGPTDRARSVWPILHLVLFVG
jgi:hypothetical protein